MFRLSPPRRLVGTVIHGFGRGSKELGVPTANMDKTAVQSAKDLKTGIYYGFAAVSGGPVYKAVTSVGWNPQYDNKEKSIEVHIVADLPDFYGEELKFIFLGYIRDEGKFESVDALVARIHIDIEEGCQELENLLGYKEDGLFI